ncbi:MAG: ribonuclease HIII [Verrucomicrobiales bacterium]|jgi:ribonuclease HIII|nr:ribonuclease HIII [Verrucomicrobiales bacterium]
MEPASFTYTLTEAQGKKLKNLLQEQGYEFAELPYGFFRATKQKCGVHYYNSGKVVINGKGAKEFIEFLFEPLVLEEARLGYEEELNPEMYEPHFGIDEAGKGDFFGPLVIAGAYTDKFTAKKLLEAGIKDSKRITSDKKTFDLEEQVKKILGTNFEVVAIFPEKYNELYSKFRNLNEMLAWGHTKVIENLHLKVPACPRALSDQFAYPQVLQRQLARKKIGIKLEQRTKAESDIAVAAASILARAAFLHGLERLGQGFDKPLGKGASAQVKEQARTIFKANGADYLKTLVKAHFKTFREVTEELF